jgi:FtsH-binding integral membrane protein
MPGCPYFIANTFAHLFGGLLISGISSENPVISDVDKKPLTGFTMLIFSLFLLYAIYNAEIGPLKYGLFALFCVILGQVMSGLMKRLQHEKILSGTLINTGVIFLCMVGVGLLDRGNMLGWGTYLSVALLGLIISMIVLALTTTTAKDAEVAHLWISRAIMVLFTLFIGFDVEVLKVNARLCKSNPDYINECIQLYLDVVNLFRGVSGSSI